MAFNISYNFVAVDKYSSIIRKMNLATKQMDRAIAQMNSSTKNFGSTLERVTTKGSVFRNTSQTLSRNTNAMTNAFNRTQVAADSFQKNIMKTSETVGGFSRTIGFAKQQVVLLGTALIGATGIKSMVDFGDTMARVKAVSQEGSAEFENLRNLAKKLGAETRFSASEAAAGIETLTIANFKSKDVMKTLPAIIDLATIGNISMAQASDSVTAALGGFALKSDDASRVVDVLARSSTLGNVTINDLSGSLQKVAPVAQSFGMSIEQITATLASLGDAGIKGELAGTGLASSLAKLNIVSKDGQRALRRLGLTVRDVSPQHNDLITIFSKLKKAGLDATTAQQLFGVEMFKVALAVANNSDKMLNNEKALRKAMGSSKRMAEIVNDELGGAWKTLISALESVFISLGDAGLNGALRSVIETVADALRGLSGFIDEYPRLIRFLGLTATFMFAANVATKALLVTNKAMLALMVASRGAMAAYTAALALYSSTTKGATIATRILTAAQMALNLVMRANPLGVVITVLSTAIAGFIAFKKEIIEVVDWLSKLFGFAGEEVIGARLNIDTNAADLSGVVDLGGIPGGAGTSPLIAQTPNVGLAAQAVTTRAQFDANINLNAPPGVVSSVMTNTIGSSTNNIGINLVGGNL